MIILNKWFKCSIWSVNGSRIGITTPSQSRPESNGKKGVLHILEMEPHNEMQFNVISRTFKDFFFLNVIGS